MRLRFICTIVSSTSRSVYCSKHIHTYVRTLTPCLQGYETWNIMSLTTTLHCECGAQVQVTLKYA